MKQQQLEQRLKELQAENDKLKAEIERAPTIVELIGSTAFEVMIEEYPSFRQSGTPTHPTDAASEVLWSCIRTMGRMDKIREDAVHRSMQATADYSDIYARLERATNALAEYAMRAVEEADQ